jgi:hypothetical protein
VDYWNITWHYSLGKVDKSQLRSIQYLLNFASFIVCHMSNINHRYVVAETLDSQSTNYLFFSEGLNGRKDVLKIIQYAYLRNYNNKSIFNLGFGDFNMNTWEINDESMTDNGDVYKIFNTVLSTMPQFFGKYPEAAVLIRGSDGRVEFEAKCKQNCTKRCTEFCHNFNRRMKLYCNYLSRKYELFEDDYQFVGGVDNNADWFEFSKFKPGKLYDSIIVSRKLFKFMV